ncbi:hypothetical protein BVI1335_2130022 [Burkholderia vietnamiensis]|nr:hypothetical protein BVI1335_2130022 [Burkholderia vietnamiensis]
MSFVNQINIRLHEAFAKRAQMLMTASVSHAV